MMRTSITATALASVVMLTGCDIFNIDNYNPPDAEITGRVVFEGEPVGVRSNGVQVELWQPSFELNQKIPVHVDQDGTFRAAVFNGSYEINLLVGNGPWVNNPNRIPVEVAGSASVDIPVQPYYTIEDETLTYLPPATGSPTGAIQATFNVRQVNTSAALELVGIYIAGNSFVDRIIGLPIPNAQRERTRTQIQAQLNANSPITFSVNLPANIYSTGSPMEREYVFVRVGVKAAGITELLYTPVYKVEI